MKIISSRFKRIMFKLLSVLKYAAFSVIFILIISTIGWDLERNDGGYLRPIFYWILDYFASASAEIVDICETPFGSLSIAKIFRIIWHLWVALSIFYFGRAICLTVKEVFESYREKQEERERCLMD
jgi:hypothetical protein